MPLALLEDTRRKTSFRESAKKLLRHLKRSFSGKKGGKKARNKFKLGCYGTGKTGNLPKKKKNDFTQEIFTRFVVGCNDNLSALQSKFRWQTTQ